VSDAILDGFALGFYALFLFWGLSIPVRLMARMLGLGA
jgi:hypothetical protein